MVLYYALGGGLGHLTRARRVLSELGLGNRAAVLTASPFARDARVTGDLPVVSVPRRLGRDRIAFRGWLADLLVDLDPDELIVDSFPGGILGELCLMELPALRLICRRLRWGAYAPRLTGALPHFAVAHVLEPLAARHAEVLTTCSQRVEQLQLPFVPAAAAPLIDQPHWLVVHAGPEEEVIELAVHAAELQTRVRRILVVCPRRPSWLPPGCEWRDIYPAAPHFPYAERIVTAAGFNLMHETSALRGRHSFVPFPRPLDDQFARAAAAARARATTVGDAVAV